MFDQLEYYPTSPDEFLIFEDYEIFGFTLQNYPFMEGIIAAEKGDVSLLANMKTVL